MLPLERQQKILKLLKVKKVLKINDFIEQLNISIETLRRDLNVLEEQGQIKKIYGGAKIVEQPYGEATMNQRLITSLQEKELIGKKCSEYIEDGECIFIDSGSTTLQIAKYIKEKKNVTVVTTSIPVVLELMHSDIDIIMVGGKIRHQEQSTVAYDYIFNFNQLNISKAFICCSGITIERGISDYNLEEVNTRKKIIDIAKEVFVVADHNKFGKDVTATIAPLQSVDYIITDFEVQTSFIKAFKNLDTLLIIAK